jgi:hypothetical protein
MVRKSHFFSTSSIAALIIIHFSLLISVCFSQSITWQRIYRVYNREEFCGSVVQTPDSGFISAGTLILRTNKFGDTLWTKLIPGSRYYRIGQASDNNYVILDDNYRLYKINISGDIIWSRGPYNNSTELYNVKATLDRGFVLVGDTAPAPVHPYFVKTDSAGNYQWGKSFVNFRGDFVDFVQFTDGNFAFCGADSSGAFILKTDGAGNQMWLKHYSNTSGGSSIALLPNKCLALAGYPFILKTDSSGNQLWIKYYQLNQRWVNIGSMIKTIDGGFALTGDVDTAGNTNYFIPLIKTDSAGNILWYRYFGSNNYDDAFCIRQTYDHGYIIAGRKYPVQDTSYAYLIKTDSTGFATPFIGIKKISDNIPISFSLSQNYPNPFNPTTKIRFSIPLAKGVRGMEVKLIIYDVLGRELSTLVNQSLKPGAYEVEFDGSNFASGIYFYRLTVGDFTQTKKIVLVK